MTLKVVARQLISAEGGKSGLGHKLFAFLLIKICKVARSLTAPTRCKSNSRLRIRRGRTFR